MKTSPISASSVGVEATSAHGQTGLINAPHSVSPVEAGGLLYTSSPQKLVPQNHQTTYEMGRVTTVPTSQMSQRRRFSTT